MLSRMVAVSALVLCVAVAIPSLADEKLPPDQLAKVEQMLKKEGFTTWEEIELDDGEIEVDDAIDASGKQFDLKIDPQSMTITKRKEEKAKSDTPK